MKTLLVLTVVMTFSLPSLACVGEAQITRVIKATKLDPTKKSCKAFVDLSLEAQKDSFFTTFTDDEIKNSKDPICKLELKEIAQEGVEIGVTEDGHCRKEAGDELEGAVQKTSDSGIVLKNLSI